MIAFGNHSRDLFMETNSARLTLSIDPDKKRLFEQICFAQYLTSSLVGRRLIREYIDQHDALITQQTVTGAAYESWNFPVARGKF